MSDIIKKSALSLLPISNVSALVKDSLPSSPLTRGTSLYGDYLIEGN